MMDGEVLDDRRGLDHHRIAVGQHRKLARRMRRVDKGIVLRRRIGADLAELERRGVGVERDQRLPSVAGERVAPKHERGSGRHHQVPALIFRCRSASRSLVEGIGPSGG